MSNPAQFSDLGTRLASAVVMTVIGAFAIVQGGMWFQALAVLIGGLMAWETLRMHGASAMYVIVGAIVFAFALGLNVIAPSFVFAIAALVLVALLSLGVSKSRLTTGVALVLILIACSALVQLRQTSMINLLFLAGCVIASDIGGYFAGRIIGGPKFWPAVSPKKTWSGTIGGWVLAAIVGVAFVSFAGFGIQTVFYGVVLAMAAQAGDLAESWMKRRAEIKDSSNLIPGHGGLLDRFDGFMGAAVLTGLVLLATGNWG
ncbi:phosphatidate cytidylyltransferase [Amylibacter ulvae]|uniref:Phosphatidate cytidylyltransferase n=1 Tax=Paramylibacter ulvae TaxID=1651968 RepID=A0ABQ3CUZ7_9RHOB|nr:phosphatidate cytidylyltransferase [Amylibacter ulvae]GHA42353.1 phosphatidate cytidylyltransferase [Amylibacter ulvae]